MKYSGNEIGKLVAIENKIKFKTCFPYEDKSKYTKYLKINNKNILIPGETIRKWERLSKYSMKLRRH